MSWKPRSDPTHIGNTAAERLNHYLPPKNGRTPAERLQAIAGKALNDGIPRIERRLNTTLTTDERNDAHSHLTLTGIKAALTYRPELDQGTTNNIPTDTRFGRFAYLRMRLALIDWERKTWGDRRPGRTPHPTIIELNNELDNEPQPLDIADLIATRDQLHRWHSQARHEGKPIHRWITDTLDQACTDRHAA